MMRHSPRTALAVGAASLLFIGLACVPAESGPATGSAGTNGGGTAGTSGAGTAGSSGAAGTTGSGGDTGAAGSSGTAGTTGSGGTAGTSSAGVGGTAGTNTAGAAGTGAGGTSAAGTSGGGRGGAGGTGTAGRGGAGGAAAGGRGGAAGTAAAGTVGTGGQGAATFTVQVQLASAVMSAAPGTIGIVTWTVDKSGLTEAHIDFGLDTSYGMTAPVDLTLTDHRTLLLGMKPAKMYHFHIVATAAGTIYTSNDYTVMTGPATTTVSISRFQIMNATANKRGFIITSYWSGTGLTVPFILDADGEIVWWGRGGPSGGIARARMSADGKNMWFTSASNTGQPLQRMTMDTLTTQTYTSVVTSHDLTAVSGETMAYLDYGETDCESIYEITPTGTPREIFESQGVVNSTGCHGNALRYSQKEDQYTYSEVSQDVFVINRAGAVQWRLSQKVTGGNTTWGGIQHGHQLLDNSIIIFANMGGGSNLSALYEYSLTGQQLMRWVGVSGDYSQNLGDVQRLPGGNTLIDFSNGSIMKEIDPQGNVVLQINGASGTRFGYALWQDTLYGPPVDISQ